MIQKCEFCNKIIADTHSPDTWKQVLGWVHGPKADSMTLREYTHCYAHNDCIKKARAGQAPDQPDLFTEPLTENIEVRHILDPEVESILDGEV